MPLVPLVALEPGGRCRCGFEPVCQLGPYVVDLYGKGKGGYLCVHNSLQWVCRSLDEPQHQPSCAARAKKKHNRKAPTTTPSAPTTAPSAPTNHSSKRLYKVKRAACTECGSKNYSHSVKCTLNKKVACKHCGSKNYSHTAKCSLNKGGTCTECG